jgi:tetratricopeptide (TPR) repeat protein
MLNRVILIAAFCVITVLQAEGDTVYTITGKTYKGRVIKNGKNIIVETDKGQVLLKAKTVIHIEVTDPIETKPKKVETEPDRPPTGATTQPGEVILPNALLHGGAIVLNNATRPEPIVYMNMRALSIAKVGAETARLRKQLTLWRAHSHDRVRKAGQQWIKPKDFVRHRKMFVEQLAEADKLRAQAKTTRRYSSSSKEPPPLTAKQKRYLNEAHDLMLKAARSWADPPMQNFLLGIALMHARKFDRAETAFKLGIKQSPLLAGLHQGLGLACAKQFRYLAALEAFLEALRLKPDSAEALYLVRETMKQVPGRTITSVLYRRAVAETMAYTTPPRPKSTSSYRTRSVEWLMPNASSRSKNWEVAETTMPTPPYDRLEFRQAVGVPLGKHTLLVDAKVVTGAVGVFVRINGVFVPATIARASYSSRNKAIPPVATVYLTDYELTPLDFASKEKPAKAGPCTIHALNIFGLMKQKIRTFAGEFKPGPKDKPGFVSTKLLPGESTAPVLSPDGKLLGFLAGKTTVALDGAGVDKFISLEEISSIVKRATSTRISIRTSSNSAKREITPKPMGDKTFVIYAILGETFKAGV